jgi:XTP/dITP diphosphohydrolase
MHTREEKVQAFGELLDVLDTLRVKCPWDRKQTNESLRPNTVEEVYELVDALMNDDNKNICKELGDVLLHVAFYAKIGEEKEAFDIADVCTKLTDKLKFRHPHIYGDVVAETPEQVSQNWEKIKLKEKDGNKSVLSGVPSALPAMIKANRIQEKARNVGFDWENREDVWAKVREEVGEVEAEMRNNNQTNLDAEFGDLLFSVINAARLYGVNPENALEHTNRKFITRFNYVESKAKEAGKNLADMALAEMDQLWNEAKKLPVK